VPVKIHQVKTRLVNSYVIEYRDKIFIVDVALRSQRYVLGFVEQELKRDPREIELVLCSHDDPDHIGGVAALAGLCGAKIAIPYASHSRRRKFYNDPFGPFTRFSTGIGEAFRARSWSMYVNRKRDLAARSKPKSEITNADNLPSVLGLNEDHRLKHNATLPGFDDWQVIHTPGHSWDSCCYYHAQSTSLLTGDTLLGSTKKGTLVRPSIYSNAKQMQNTLHRLKQLQPRNVYPGHGSMFQGQHLIESAG